MQNLTITKKLAAEALGSALLLAVVVGSGIMAERLAGENVALALLANALATGAGLIALILMLGPISGAHFNPVVSLAAAVQKQMQWRQTALFVVAQIAGAILGVAIAHIMFDLPLFFASEHSRTGVAQWFSEFVATFGLLAVIISTSKSRPAVTPFAVASYIVSAYWFTASTSFANPAVTIARAMTNTFAGIHPADVAGFILAQILGACAATLVFSWLYQD